MEEKHCSPAANGDDSDLRKDKGITENGTGWGNRFAGGRMTDCLDLSQCLMFVLKVRAVSFAKWKNYSFWILLCEVRVAGRETRTC